VPPPRYTGRRERIEVSFSFPSLYPEEHMIGFESDQAILQTLRERLRSMTDEGLILVREGCAQTCGN
jgi:hypothetical protein